MAVAFDAVGPTSAGQVQSATTAFTWTHTPSGTPTEAVVFLVAGLLGGSAAGQVGSFASVSYGASAMTLDTSVAGNNSTFGGIFCYKLASPPSGSQTISVGAYTPPSGATFSQTLGFSLSFTGGGGGFATAPTPASGNAASGSLAFSGTTSGGLCVAGACDGSGVESVTAGTQRFLKDQNFSSMGCGVGATLASSGTTTISFAWTADFYGITGVEVLPPAAGGVTWAPSRYGQAAPASPAPWIQQGRRNANTVATAADPLVSPLDTAWQADGRYWHLYGDTATRDRRAYFTQRNYISDPNLLSAVNADPLALNPEQSNSSDLWRAAAVPAFYDRRLVPQQRVYYGPPVTAELENELLGGADTARHYGWFTDRREVPQQRPYVSDPALLATAELENELLGGGDTGRTYATPATHAARWWMPQQPARLADPMLITIALLENELLGGADMGRYYLIAAYWDRRGYPQQRLYESDPNLLIPPVPFDPTAGGQDDLGRRQRQPATHYDRREVPQQRPYISDPSFYPTVAPTDPLTVAWGAGGNYWHLYNRAADITDRREVPQQRAYISPPGLLATAELENELLGGGDDLARHRAWYDSRREVPSQPARLADPLLITTALLEPPLLGGADDLRRHASVFTDRRLVPILRPGTAPPDIPADPLTLGDDRARHLLAAGYWPRGWSWFQRQFFPVPPPPPPPPVLQNAVSAPAVTAQRGSAPGVTDPRDGTSQVTARAASGPAVSDG